MRDLLISHLNNMPLIGILRGVKPDEAVDTVGALYAAGFRMVEYFELAAATATSRKSTPRMLIKC